MAKKLKLDLTSTADKVAADEVTKQPVSVVQYGIGKLPRNGLNEGTKHGQGGTAGTYKAVCKALAAANGRMTIAEIQAVCTTEGDKGFARYAVRNHWFLPVDAVTKQ